MGASAASDIGDDLAGCGAGPAVGDNHAVESHRRGVGPAVGTQLPQHLPAALDGPAPKAQTLTPLPQGLSTRRAALKREAEPEAVVHIPLLTRTTCHKRRTRHADR